MGLFLFHLLVELFRLSLQVAKEAGFVVDRDHVEKEVAGEVGAGAAVLAHVQRVQGAAYLREEVLLGGNQIAS